jgi:hypothetical protein
MDYLKEIQRRVKEIELSRWGDYFLNDALSSWTELFSKILRGQLYRNILIFNLFNLSKNCKILERCF